MGTATVTYRNLELEIEFEATPYTPARMYLSNGDPGYPEEGGDFEIHKVSIQGVDITDLFDGDFEDLEQEYFRQNEQY